MNAKLKSDYRWNTIRAFGGSEFVKSEFRPVPAGQEVEAKAHPYLEIEPEAEPVADAKPEPKPEAPKQPEKGKGKDKPKPEPKPEAPASEKAE
jgi:hypothetical protein